MLHFATDTTSESPFVVRSRASLRHEGFVAAGCCSRQRVYRNPRCSWHLAVCLFRRLWAVGLVACLVEEARSGSRESRAHVQDSASFLHRLRCLSRSARSSGQILSMWMPVGGRHGWSWSASKTPAESTRPRPKISPPRGNVFAQFTVGA